MYSRNYILLLLTLALVVICAGCSNYVQQARIYESLGDYNSAVIAYEKMIEKSSGARQGYALAGLGRIKLTLGKNWEAEEILRKAKKILAQHDPIYPEVCFNLGYCYYLRGEQWYNQAIAEMNEAVSLKEDYQKVHYYLGSIYFRTKKYQQSLSHMLRVKGENEDRALYVSGLCYQRLGDYENSVLSLTRAVELAKNKEDKSEYITALQMVNEEIAKQEKAKKKIEIVNLKPIFMALSPIYANEPFGVVRVTNRLEQTLKDVKVLVEVKDFSSSPTPNVVGDLTPGQVLEVPIKVVIDSQKAREQRENIPVHNVSVTLEYSLGGTKSYERVTGHTRIYNVNTIDWNPSDQVAVFVVGENPALKKLVNHIPLADTPLNKAAQIYDLLKLYGMKYVRDPNNPFGTKLDNVSYPWESLETKKGDCDDLSVLYASCLESVGVETGFLLTKDHIFVTLNAGLPEDRAKVVIPGAELYQIRDGIAWIPVEVTMLGTENTSFYDAWIRGSEEYSSDLEFVRLSEAWEKYQPILTGPDLDLDLPDRNLVLTQYNEDVAKVRDHWSVELNKQILSWQSMLEKGEGSEAELRNLIAINYALNRDFESAKKELERATILEPTVGKYHNNLANVLFLLGDIDRAKAEYDLALDHCTKKGGLFYNLVVFNYALGDSDRASQINEMAKGTSEVADEFTKIAKAYVAGSALSTFGSTGDDTMVAQSKKSEKIDRSKVKALLGIAAQDTRASGISDPEDPEWLFYWMR